MPWLAGGPSILGHGGHAEGPVPCSVTAGCLPSTMVVCRTELRNWRGAAVVLRANRNGMHGGPRVSEHRLPDLAMANAQHCSAPPGCSLQLFPPHSLQDAGQQASMPCVPWTLPGGQLISEQPQGCVARREARRGEPTGTRNRRSTFAKHETCTFLATHLSTSPRPDLAYCTY